MSKSLVCCLFTALLVFCTVAPFSGCQDASHSEQPEGDHREDESHDDNDEHKEGEHDDDEHAHHQPEHKPADYLSGVSRLNELHESLQAGDISNDDAGEAIEEMSDIARWLPELAADSDLTESPWNVVYASARELHLALERVHSLNLDSQVAAYRSQDSSFATNLKHLREVAANFPG